MSTGGELEQRREVHWGNLLANFVNVQFQAHKEKEEDESQVGKCLQHSHGALRENGCSEAWDVSESRRPQQDASQNLCKVVAMSIDGICQGSYKNNPLAGYPTLAKNKFTTSLQETIPQILVVLCHPEQLSSAAIPR